MTTIANQDQLQNQSGDQMQDLTLSNLVSNFPFKETYVGSLDYYLMSFIAPIQSFSNSDNAMIRNHLVNSIKLLDATDMAKSEFP